MLGISGCQKQLLKGDWGGAAIAVSGVIVKFSFPLRQWTAGLDNQALNCRRNVALALVMGWLQKRRLFCVFLWPSAKAKVMASRA